MAEITELTSENFDNVVIESDKPYLVDFWAPWCQPCLSMASVLKDFADHTEGQIKVGKINIDENVEIAERFNVQSIPTFAIFIDGKVEKQVVGSMDKDRLVENFQTWLY